MGLSTQRPAAAALVGRAVLSQPFTRVYGGAHGVTRPTNAFYRAAARLISSKDAGFSKAEVSPSFSPKYAARTIRRITFAFRVFGMSPTKMISRGASALPRSRATFFFNSAASATSPFASFFKTQKQTSASPLMESGTPIAAASLAFGCATRTDSTSAGPTRLPAILIVSSERGGFLF